MSETLSPSRMNCLLECPRKHYYKYELGIEKVEKSKALSLGSAWADFKERFRRGAPVELAVAQVVEVQKDIANLNIPQFVAMATAYGECYGDRDVYRHIYPEVEFKRHMDELPGDFIAIGRLDAICVTHGGEHVINEDKSTSQDISQGAPYWDRLFFNVQALQYVCEVRLLGWDVHRVVYEAARKPKTERKTIPTLDENGQKIVICDETGERAYNKDGKPRQAAGEGFTIQGRMETDDEYAGRMKADIVAAPEKWFAQQDIWVTDDSLDEFACHRLACVRTILANREAGAALADPAKAWPRNVDSMRCRMCDYCGFCLQGGRPDPDALPEGFISRRHGTQEEQPQG